MVKYKWNFSKKEIEEIVRLYTEEMNSVSHIAKLYNIGNWVIQRVLKNEKIDIRDNNMYKSKAVDSKFFEVIDTEEKAYWLGFIYADGYVTQHKSSLTFGINLSYTDLNHLIKLKQTLKSDHKIVTGLGNTSYGPSHFCKLCITNKCLVKNLISKGVVFNKSKILKPPTPDQIPNHLIHHFIRGYFDGDGSVYSSKRNEGAISMIGTEDLLNWILNHIKTFVTTKAQVLKYKTKDIWEFKIGGTNNFINVYKYLYKDATVYLDRKYNKFHDIFSIRKIDVQRL